DVDRLGDVVQAALEAVLRARAACERQHVAVLVPEERRPRERGGELEELQPGELERLRERREAEVDLDVGAHEELEQALDVEDGQRVAAVRENVRLQLVEPDLAVAGGVVEVEVD